MRDVVNLNLDVCYRRKIIIVMRLMASHFKRIRCSNRKCNLWEQVGNNCHDLGLVPPLFNKFCWSNSYTVAFIVGGSKRYVPTGLLLLNGVDYEEEKMEFMGGIGTSHVLWNSFIIDLII